MMRKRLFAITSLLVLTLGVVAGYAQKPKARVEIPFNFSAGGNELPAGAYVIATETGNPNLLIVRGEKGKQSGLCPVLTRLGPTESSKPQLVFDKVGEKRVLSEVYLPGVDGYQLAGTKGEHTHEKLSGEASK